VLDTVVAEILSRIWADGPKKGAGPIKRARLADDRLRTGPGVDFAAGRATARPKVRKTYWRAQPIQVPMGDMDKPDHLAFLGKMLEELPGRR